MHNRSMVSFCSRLLVGLVLFHSVFKASDALAGEGWIVIDESLGMRPMLFFSDTVGGTEYREIQGGWKLKVYNPPNPDKRIEPSGMDLKGTVPYYFWFTYQAPVASFGSVAHPAMSHNFDWLRFNESGTAWEGVHKWRGLFTESAPSFIAGADANLAPYYRYWSGVIGDKVAFCTDNTSKTLLYSSQPASLNLQFTCYRIPAELNFTTLQLSGYSWGWWGDHTRYDVDANFNVTAIRDVIGDNASMPPSRPVNQVTGKQYPAGVFEWTWDSTTSRWVGHNNWTDATKVPTVANGPTGQWRFGVNPNGNQYNSNPEGSEWYWDGPGFEGITLPGPTTPTPTQDPWTGGTTTTPLTSSETTTLLSAIEQNTRSSKSSLLGLSTAIPGFRSEVHTDLTAIQQALRDRQTELMSCLNGHHKIVEYNLVAIATEAAAARVLQGQILGELSTGFGGVIGALAGIGVSTQATAQNTEALGMAVAQTAQTAASISQKMDTSLAAMNQGFGDLRGGLSAIESQASSAVQGLDRIDGHILTGNQLQQENIDMWASQILHWNTSEDQSLAKLQHLCDVGDTLKEFNENIATDSNHMRIFWELEKIRWIARDNQDQQTQTDIKNEAGATNQKLDELIDQVAAIPPPETPETDLTGVETRLDALKGAADTLIQITIDNGAGGPGEDWGWLKADIATIKFRLASIDNALNTRVEPEKLGELKLDKVQEEVRDDLETKVKGFWDKLTGFENDNKSKIDYVNMGSGRSPNPRWFSMDFNFSTLHYDFTLDWSEEKYAAIMVFRPLWRMIEIWALYILCLFQCYKVLLEV